MRHVRGNGEGNIMLIGLEGSGTLIPKHQCC